jgi:hypothetical protein
MDTKYKIIIVVFILIALLYAGHFIIDYMNSNKNKEKFTLFDDDVEHYEDSQDTKSVKKNIASESRRSKKNIVSNTTSDESKYDLRVLILDDIESLKITNKEIKGYLMETMFEEDTLKKVAILSDKERLEFIKDKSTLFEKSTSVEKSTLTKSTEKLISQFKGVDDTDNENTNNTKTSSKTPSNTPSNSALSQELVHRTEDAMTKLQNVKKELDTVQKSLTDMQKYAVNIDPSTKIDLSTKSGFSMPEIPELPGMQSMGSTSVIEGFENIRGFAPIF